MSILTRPRPPRSDDRTDAEALEALIEEARRRTRRRRRGYAAFALAAAAAGLLGFYGLNGGGGTARPSDRAQSSPEVGITPQLTYGRWQSALGLEGGMITAIGVDPQVPNTVFAATLEAGVFKSENGGRTWRPLDLAPGVNRVDALAIAPGDPKTVYVGTGRGVFKTTNGGTSWEATSSELLANETAEERQHRNDEGYVYGLVVDRRDPNIVYAGTWEKGVFKTTDGGRSWRNIGLSAVSSLVLDPRDPETVYAGTVGAAAGPTGLFKSSDGGASWHVVGFRGTNVGALALDPQHPETVYAGTDGKGLFKTRDGGRTWRKAGLAGEDIGGLILNSKSPENVYAESRRRIFVTSDGGRTWRPLNEGWVPGTWPSVLALDQSNFATIYAGTITAVDGKGNVGAGVYKSVDGGDSWRSMNAGLTDASVSALALDPRRPGTAYAGIDGRGVFKRIDGRWRPADSGLTSAGVHAVAVDPRDPANVYAGTDGGVFKSTNGAASWRPSLKAPFHEATVVSALAVDPQDPNTVYAITADDSISDYHAGLWRVYESRVFKSSDGGVSWREGGEVQKLKAPAPPNAIPAQTVFMTPVVIDPLDPDTLYAGGLGVLKSTDGGTSWREAGLARTPVGTLAIDPKEPAIVYAGTDAGLFKSTSAGASWQPLHGPLDGLRVEAVALDPRHAKTLYAGTDRGVFTSTDGGRSWRGFDHLPLRSFDALAVDSSAGLLYAGAYGGGIFELRLSR